MSGNDPSLAPPDRHRWFRSRLDAAVSQLLSETDQRSFDEHVAACPECRAAVQLHRDNLPEPDTDYGHLPAFIMARWDRRAGGLRGLERKLARVHLDSCGACRAALEVLGFESRLAEDPILEGAHEAGRSGRPVADEGLAWGRRVRDWLIGGTGGALVAAAAALLLVPILARRGPPTAMTPPVVDGPRHPSPAPAVPGYSVEILPPAPRLPAFDDATRGSHARVARETRLRVAPGTRFVQFPLPVAYSGSAVEIDVFGPTDSLLAHESVPFGTLAARSGILFGHPERALVAGSYRLRVVIHPVAGSVANPDTFETGVRLDLEEAP